MVKQCLIIAGEKSGEEHALSFFDDLQLKTPDTKYFGVGGDELEKRGVEILYHLRDFSSMGFTEVIRKIRFYFKALEHIENEVLRRGCKTAILIDFQGFNLKLAERLKAHGVEVLYYVAPQAWSWKAWRVKKLRQAVHTLFTILPFEKKWFLDRGVKQVKGVIHPLMITYKNMLSTLPRREYPDLEKRELRILLLPGSRNHEVQTLLPIFLESIEKIRAYGYKVKVSIVQVNSVKEEGYRPFADKFDQVYMHQDLTTAMSESDVCLAASGTVTLSTGLFGLPTVVCYKMSLVNYLLIKALVTYKGPVSLTNIIHNDYVFPEFLQYKVTSYNIAESVLKWLSDRQAFDKLLERLKKTQNLLEGDDFSVPEYMAKIINRAE